MFKIICIEAGKKKKVGVKWEGKIVRRCIKVHCLNLLSVALAVGQILRIQIKILGYKTGEVNGRLVMHLEIEVEGHKFSFTPRSRKWVEQEVEGRGSFEKFLSNLAKEDKILKPKPKKVSKTTPWGETVEWA